MDHLSAPDTTTLPKMPSQRSADQGEARCVDWGNSSDENGRSGIATPGSGETVENDASLPSAPLGWNFLQDLEDPFIDSSPDPSRNANPIRAPTFPTLVQMEQNMLKLVSQN